MKALILKEKGAYPVYDEAPEPLEKTGEVLVRLKAASLNHRDVWICKGQYAGIRFPVILGSDGAGLVNGREVIINPSMGWGDHQGFQGEGYQIVGMPGDGTFAEQIAVPAVQIYNKPAHLSFEQAAALPLAGLTAYRAIFSRAGLKQGEKVFINGIGGGVALLACQFALAAGAKVYVSSGSDEKIDKAMQLGVNGGVNYHKEGWASAYAKETGGFDVIVDSAGGPGFGDLLRLGRPGSRIVVYGGSLGPIQMSPQMLFWKQMSILGSTMGSAEDFQNMLLFVAKHKIAPMIDSVFDLKNGIDALSKMDRGEQFGKIVLRIP